MWPSPGSLGTTAKAVSKTHLFRCLTPMLVQQMPINFVNENTAIFVTKPGGNRNEINSCHHAHGTKIMPQNHEIPPSAVRRQHARSLNSRESSSRVRRAARAVVRGSQEQSGATSHMHLVQKGAKLRIKFHGAAFPILR